MVYKGKIHILRGKGNKVFCNTCFYNDPLNTESFEEFFKKDFKVLDLKPYCEACLIKLKVDILKDRVRNSRPDVILNENKEFISELILNKPFDEKDLIVKPRVTPLNLENNETMLRILKELDNTDEKKQDYLNLSDNENKLLSQRSSQKALYTSFI